jgi:phospholipase D
MKFNMIRFFCALTAMLLAIVSPAYAFTATCEVMFSPNGGIEQTVVRYIDNTKTSLDILAYNYTNDAIGTAVRNAYARGVKVRVIVDKTGPSEKGAEIGLDKVAGIATYVDATYKIAHSKVMVLDHAIVLTGSYNWSNNAEKSNSENIVFCKSVKMAKIYADRFEYLLTKAKPF